MVEHENTAPNDGLNSRERTQLAYLANALANFPLKHADFLRIAAEEGAGSEGIAVVVKELQKLLGSKSADHALLRKISADFVKREGALRYAGQALAGSLENWKLKK